MCTLRYVTSGSRTNSRTTLNLDMWFPVCTAARTKAVQALGFVCLLGPGHQIRGAGQWPSILRELLNEQEAAVSGACWLSTHTHTHTHTQTQTHTHTPTQRLIDCKM